ncbi:MAG TPA: phage tail tape measure protein [Chitinophagales bacterium]|nr:phage tail tape measure protein [Chitinophagales bacterium]
MASTTTSIKVFIDDKEAGKSIFELRKRYSELKAEIESPNQGKGLQKLQQEFDKVSKSILQAEKQLKEFRSDGVNKMTLLDNIKQLKKEFKEAGDNVQLAAEKMKLLRAEQAKLDNLNSILSGNKNSPAGQNISAVKKEVSNLSRAIESQLIPGTKEYEAALQRLAVGKKIIMDHRNAMREVEAALQDTAQSGSFNALKKQYDILEKEIDDLTIGTKEYIAKTKELQSIDKQIAVHEHKVKGVSKAWQFAKSEMKSFGIVALGALGVGALTSQISQLISRSADLSDIFADVGRTTNLAQHEVQELYKEFKDFNTRTPRSELLELAVVAGKLGITGKNDVKNFVEEANKIQVALGSDLGDDAIRQIAKISDVFKVAEANGLMVGDAMTLVGNTVNKLGETSTASEKYIVDFLFRMGGIGTQAKMALPEVAALGSTLDQLGLTAEVSSTAMSQVIMDMFLNTSEYAKIAGMEVSEFNDILQTDSTEAFTLFLEGLNGNNEGLSIMGKKLDNLTINGVRGISVITSLAKNTKILRDTLKEANAEYANGNSMMEEYNRRNENFAGSMQRVSRKIGEFFLNSGFVKGIQSMVIWLDKATVATNKHASEVEKERKNLFQLESQLFRTNTSHKERVKIINELKQIYPQHLANINAETATNDQLRKSLKLVNDQLINKIILAKKDDEIEKQNNKTAEKKMKMLEFERKAEEELYKFSKKNNVPLMGGKDIFDQADKMMKKVRENIKKNNKGVDLGYTTREKDLNFFLDAYRTFIKSVNKLEGEGNLLLEERIKLMDKLGIKDDESKSVTDNEDASVYSPIEDVETTEDKAKKSTTVIQDFAERIKQIQREIVLNSLSQNQRELEEIYDRYQKEIDAVEKAKAEVLKAEDLSYKQKLALIQKYNIDVQTLEDLMILEYNLKREAQAKKNLEDFNKQMTEENKIRVDAQQKITEGVEAFQKTIDELYLTDQEKQIKRLNEYYDNLLDEVTKYYQEYMKLLGMTEEEFQKILDKIKDAKDIAIASVENPDKESKYEVDEDFKALGDAGKVTLSELKAIKKKIIEEFGPEEGKKIFEEFFQPFIENRAEYIDAIVDVFGQGTDAIIDMFKLIGAEGERAAAFQKGLAFFQIITESAVAMAKAVTAAMASGATIWVRIAGAIAAIATITSMFARIKSTMSSADVPSYAEGGDTGPGTYVDNTGEKVAGVVHANEYVVPRWMRTIPRVADSIGMLESIRTSRRYNSGGDVFPSSTAPASVMIPSSSNSNSTSEVNVQIETDAKLLEAINKLLNDGVSISWDKLAKTANRLNNIDKSA